MVHFSACHWYKQFIVQRGTSISNSFMAIYGDELKILSCLSTYLIRYEKVNDRITRGYCTSMQGQYSRIREFR